MKLENIIHIDAPPDTVWNVTNDVERWPEWNSNFESIQRLDDGPFDIGSAAFIKQRGMPEPKWTVTALEHGESFTWETRVRAIRMIGTHNLSATESGTQNLLRIEMSGWVAWLMWPLLRGAVKRALEKENQGLKQRCEQIANT